MDNLNITEKKKKFDNYELSINDFTEEELVEINKMYSKEIEDMKEKLKNGIMKKIVK